MEDDFEDELESCEETKREESAVYKGMVEIENNVQQLDIIITQGCRPLLD